MKYNVMWRSVDGSGYELTDNLDSNSPKVELDTPEEAQALADQRNEECRTDPHGNPWHYHYFVREDR
jgi:hypothetical protein